MSKRQGSQLVRATLTFVGATVAAMVDIAGLVCLALFIMLMVGMGNFGSNK